MPHVDVVPGLPGISGLLAKYPQGAALAQLAESLLRGESPLSPGERELIAAYVSRRNGCVFCTRSHAAAARVFLAPALVDAVLEDAASAPLEPRTRALLAIAEEVRRAVAPVSDEALRAAREAGAEPRMVHDAALIAAAFCMFNRYVDGLATEAPDDDAAYAAMGQVLATQGYVRARVPSPSAG